MCANAHRWGVFNMPNVRRGWLEIIQLRRVRLAAQYYGAFSESPNRIILAVWFGVAVLGFKGSSESRSPKKSDS